jgi:hypothetical protein
MMGTSKFAAALLVVALASAAAVARSYPPAGHVDGGEQASDWREIAWPFLRDAWEAGRSFRCEAATCPRGLTVHVRPKIGFCNCATGVADDDEVDRVGDVVLLGDDFAAAAAGYPIVIGGMQGRARPYLVKARQGPVLYALGAAYAKDCNVVVAMAVSEQPITAELERLTLDELNSPQVGRWVEASLGAK